MLIKSSPGYHDHCYPRACHRDSNQSPGIYEDLVEYLDVYSGSDECTCCLIAARSYFDKHKHVRLVNLSIDPGDIKVLN